MQAIEVTVCTDLCHTSPHSLVLDNHRLPPIGRETYMSRSVIATSRYSYFPLQRHFPRYSYSLSLAGKLAPL